MPRIPYLTDAQAQPPDLVAAIRTRRGGTLLNLDRMLLHSPALAQGWNAHLGAVRTGLGLEAKLRELAICGVAVLNDAEYEFFQHAPEYVKAGGSEAALQALRHFESAGDNDALFNATERAVMKLTLEMTRNVAVSDQTFAAARVALGNEQHLVELAGVIATYNMVSRFLVALGVHPE
jgi:alkylhydroperoxidase family enzyme